MNDYFELGRILRPQGIRGEVKAELYTDDPGRVRELAQIYFRSDDGYRAAPVASARTDGRFGFIRLDGVEDRSAAEALRGCTFYIDREHAAPLPEGAFYVSDLVGLPVFVGEAEIGTLREILQTGAKDIYVTDLSGGGQLLFPSVPDVFVTRDVRGGRIVLDERRLKEVGVYDI